MVAEQIITIKGDTTPVRALLERLDAVTEPFALAGWLEQFMYPWMQERVRARFGSEGDDVSGAWTPLSEATQEIRSHLGYGAAHPINVRTGALWNFAQSGDVSFEAEVASLAMPADKGVAVSTTQSTSTDVALYGGVAASPAEKFMVAQMGYQNTPARPVLGVGTKDAAFALANLMTFISAAAQGGAIASLGAGL